MLCFAFPQLTLNGGQQAAECGYAGRDRRELSRDECGPGSEGVSSGTLPLGVVRPALRRFGFPYLRVHPGEALLACPEKRLVVTALHVSPFASPHAARTSRNRR